MRARPLISVGLLAAEVVLGGCLALPIPAPEADLALGRGAVSDDVIASLRTPGATREDVLLALGEPSARFEHDRLFIYHWSMTNAYIAVGTIVPAGAFVPITDDRAVVVAFDDRGRVLACERLVIDSEHSFAERVEEWRQRVRNPAMSSGH